jgi:hypothetical protein
VKIFWLALTVTMALALSMFRRCTIHTAFDAVCIVIAAPRPEQ